MLIFANVNKRYYSYSTPGSSESSWIEHFLVFCFSFYLIGRRVREAVREEGVFLFLSLSVSRALGIFSAEMWVMSGG